MTKKTIRSKLAVAAVAFGSLWVAQAANAHTDVYFSVGVPVQSAPVYVQPAPPVYLPQPQVVYPAAPTDYANPGYGDDNFWEQRRAWREAEWREQQWRDQQWREQQWRQQQWRQREWEEHHSQAGQWEHHGRGGQWHSDGRERHGD